MRKTIIAIMFLLIIPSAFAALCSDTDGGGQNSKDAALKTKGEVKYGITPMTDTCLTTEEGVSTNSSKWLREYFCENDQRQNKVYDCAKYGYDRCTNGECVGSGSNQTQTRPQEPEKTCGNKRLEKDKGEQCDPPQSICFGKTSEQYGICNPDCTCKIAKSAPPPASICGDEERDTSEECEEDKDCPTNYLCSSCKCVKQLTPEEIEAMKNKPKPRPEDDEDDEEKDADEGHSDVNLSSTNFSDNAGIKATSGITSFFKKIFSWLGTLFG